MDWSVGVRAVTPLPEPTHTIDDRRDPKVRESTVTNDMHHFADSCAIAHNSSPLNSTHVVVIPASPIPGCIRQKPVTSFGQQICS
jgi:hypothetical protein